MPDRKFGMVKIEAVKPDPEFRYKDIHWKDESAELSGDVLQWRMKRQFAFLYRKLNILLEKKHCGLAAMYG